MVGKLKESRIQSIYDLYKVDTDEKKSPSFTDNLFKLSIDNGSFIIVLDGLDEIISKLGDNFQLISFLERIYQDYCFNLSKTKIIITCRDSVWEEAVSGKNIAHLPPKSIYSMKAFNFAQVEEFFRTCFKNEQESNKLEKKAKSFVEKLITTTGNKSNENIYSPFILDRIREIVLDNISDQELEELFDDNYNLESLCFSKSDRNDYFIYSVCKREISKTQISIENQIKFLCSLCKYDDFLSHHEFCNELENILNRKITKQDEHSFISHPFIYSNDSRTKISLKYDFLKDFFSKILIAQYLTSESNIIDNKYLNILVDNAGYLNVFSRSIGNKIIECKHDINSVTFNILHNIDELSKRNQEIAIEEEERKQNYKIISSLFLIYLSILSEKKNLKQEDLNNALKEIFGAQSNKILNLCLCDIQNLNTNQKLKFDFSNLDIENPYIKDYSEFFNCTFNEKTQFKNGKILFSSLPSYEKRKNYPFNKNHFINCQFSNNMEELLNDISDSSENKKKNKEKILFDFVRKFHNSGRFRPKKQSEIRAKQGQYVDAMLEAGIITPHEKTKLNEPEYIINPDYEYDLLESLNNNDVNIKIRRILKNINL